MGRGLLPLFDSAEPTTITQVKGGDFTTLSGKNNLSPTSTRR